MANLVAFQESPKRFTALRKARVPGLPDGVSAVMGRMRGTGEEVFAAFAFHGHEGWDAEKSRAWLHSQKFMALLQPPPPGLVLDVDAADAVAPQKRRALPELAQNLSMRVESVKAVQKKSFGWLYVCERADETKVVDWSGEVISEATFEAAFYDYVQHTRRAGCMHIKDPATGLEVEAGTLCEGVMVTREKRALWGVTSSTGLHIGAWVGIQWTDDAVWARIQSGELRMFSLSGWATPVPYGGT